MRNKSPLREDHALRANAAGSTRKADLGRTEKRVFWVPKFVADIELF